MREKSFPRPFQLKLDARRKNQERKYISINNYRFREFASASLKFSQSFAQVRILILKEVEGEVFVNDDRIGIFLNK